MVRSDCLVKLGVMEVAAAPRAKGYMIYPSKSSSYSYAGFIARRLPSVFWGRITKAVGLWTGVIILRAP